METTKKPSTVTATNPMSGTNWEPLTAAERAMISRQIQRFGFGASAMLTDRQIALVNAGGLEA